jgi:threonine/homoserine/homoserine lactone efflux protein
MFMLAEYLPKMLLAWSIQLMGVISPGPSVMLILGVATSRGRALALTTAFGIACGSIILSTATVLGVAVIFADLAIAMTAVRIVGAVYLFWLAWKAFGKAIHPPALEMKATRNGDGWNMALSGFLLQISNPKAILFWLAIAGIGGLENAPAPILLLFVFVAFVNSFLGHGGYALLLSAAPVRGFLQRFRGWVEGFLGCFFIFAGYKILTSRT